MTDAERLARLGKLLNAKRLPFYQRHPIPPHLRTDFPSEGWYWIPKDKDTVQHLARDSYDAYHRLMTQIEEIS